MAIRLLASGRALFYKHHMLNEMFMIDKWMVSMILICISLCLPVGLAGG